MKTRRGDFAIVFEHELCITELVGATLYTLSINYLHLENQIKSGLFRMQDSKKTSPILTAIPDQD